ncbi:Uncharacterised protein [Shewanella morhuae]|uniref:Uncharacterized protein n=1 Tax=Shewanella morhuae TaxID=365591 RepID=A0A380C776_9GAMM|nr:Uncharacterised protein [Shewanella morhuae]
MSQPDIYTLRIFLTFITALSYWRLQKMPIMVLKPFAMVPMRFTLVAQHLAHGQRRATVLKISRVCVLMLINIMRKYFVALNTILMDDELSAAEKLIWQLYEAGV